jgi:hypothetical protein
LSLTSRRTDARVTTIRNGWQLFYFSLFKAALDELERTVSTLAKRDPAAYKRTRRHDCWRQCIEPLQKSCRPTPTWFNDEHNLRKVGSKTDVYEAFRRMLLRGRSDDIDR